MSKKILLIESDAAMARVLSSALEARGFAARVTGDGKEGLELARADRPDVIVLCVELPKMSGYAVCNKLKKDEELKAIPLVITSAEATAETFEAHRKLKARAEEYLIKPFDGAALLEKIASLIEMPSAPEGADEVVTLEDVEEIDPLEIEPAALESFEPADAVGDAGLAGSVARPRGEAYDDDLRLLDEAFENIAQSGGSAGRQAEEVAQESLAPFDSPGPALSDIDRLGAEADAALAALQAEPTDEQFAAAAVAFGEAPGAIAPPAQRVVSSLPHDDGADAASALEAKGRAAQLTLELARAREAIAARDAELADLRPRAQSLASDLEAQTARTRRLEEQAQRANEEVARLTESAHRDEEGLRAAQDEIRAAEERLKEAEALAASEQDRADREEKERLALQTAARGAEERARAAEERTRAAEERARAAEERTRATEERARAAEERAHASEEGTRAAEEQARAAEERAHASEEGARAAEEQARAAEERAHASEEGTRAAEEQARAAEERAHASEEGTRAAEDRARAAEERAHASEEGTRAAEGRARASEERAHASEEQTRAADERARAAEERAEAAERELAELRRKLDEREEASALQAREADAARRRAEELAQEIESLRSRIASQEGEIAALQPQLDSSRQALSDLRGESDATAAEAQRRISALEAAMAELQAQGAKHEERILKAYQKIRADEKMREKTRKALGIALQLLEDRPAQVTGSDDQPRRE